MLWSSPAAPERASAVSAISFSTPPVSASPIPAVADDSGELRAFSGEAKPDFSLPGLAGETRSLSGLRGQPVLLHFFATWCEPCRPEMQALERFAETPQGRAFRIIAVSIAEPAPRVQRFFETFPVSFPILLDADRSVAKAWNVKILPTSYLLDPDLKPQFVVERDLEWDRLDLSRHIDILKRSGRSSASRPPYPIAHQQGGK